MILATLYWFETSIRSKIDLSRHYTAISSKTWSLDHSMLASLLAQTPPEAEKLEKLAPTCKLSTVHWHMEQGRLPHAPPWAPRASSARPTDAANSDAMDESGSRTVASESYCGGEGGSGARRAHENVVPPPLMWTAPHIAATVVVDAPNSDMVDDAALSDKSLASQSYFGDGDDQTMKPAARVDGSLHCAPCGFPRPIDRAQEVALPSGSMPNPRDTGVQNSQCRQSTGTSSYYGDGDRAARVDLDLCPVRHLTFHGRVTSRKSLHCHLVRCQTLEIPVFKTANADSLLARLLTTVTEVARRGWLDLCPVRHLTFHGQVASRKNLHCHLVRCQTLEIPALPRLYCFRFRPGRV